MRINAMTKAALTAVAVLAAAPMAVAPVATAAYPIVGKLGSTLQTTDTVGQVTYSWRVSGLQPSSDPTPGFPVAGKVWEATATVNAIRGTVTPAISQFNAVAPDRAAYRVLWQVASPRTISGATIPQGAQSSGKIYFDVTGPPPTTVTMNNGMEDLMIWGP
ncbi:MPT63 family protein [[Mycobacterium] kokjensenii]|uniref:MPT63 family protein n=1 Tax=[Mycobacterium] kokjensenii TaxID=3064287 RepID=A0ABM9LEI5_9MYCO|nr:MPT63 family protein [Mycolicibacter sp. MU0083]CAJ1497605.1 MPT63 family protein [Mycolicibacter sp. MU0083]